MTFLRRAFAWVPSRLPVTFAFVVCLTGSYILEVSGIGFDEASLTGWLYIIPIVIARIMFLSADAILFFVDLDSDHFTVYGFLSPIADSLIYLIRRAISDAIGRLTPRRQAFIRTELSYFGICAILGFVLFLFTELSAPFLTSLIVFLVLQPLLLYAYKDVMRDCYGQWFGRR